MTTVTTNEVTVKVESESLSGDCDPDRSDNKCSERKLTDTDILAEARRSFFEFFDVFFGTRSTILAEVDSH